MRSNERHWKDDEHGQLLINERLFEAPPYGIRVVITHTGIFLPDAVFGIELVFVGEEVAGALKGIVWEEGHNKESYHDKYGAFDYEEPFLGDVRFVVRTKGCLNVPRLVFRLRLPCKL